jgi:hypothetical protein
MILHIKLFGREEEIIRRAKELGYPVPEIIRQWIREGGTREFPDEPLYAKVAKEKLDLAKKIQAEKASEEKMTNAEYAEQVLRGKAHEKTVEFRNQNGDVVEYLLDNIKTTTRTNDSGVIIHNEILDGTFIYANGEKMTDEQRATALKGW